MLRTIKLNNNGIGDIGATAFADAWRENTGLRHLDLTDNRINEAGIRSRGTSVLQVGVRGY